MTTIVSFIILLGILIFIHELGHFAVAKYVGVGVDTFSLGFGPRLFGFKRGETDYRISLVPFGGYVKMWGDSFDEQAEEERIRAENEDLGFAELEAKVKEFKQKSFLLKPLGSRMAIVAAGPIMNLALAVVLFPVIYMIGIEAPAFLEKKPVIAYVASDTPAMSAGVMKGDVITRLNGAEIATWAELEMKMAIAGKIPFTFEFDRDGVVQIATFTPEVREKTGLGFAPPHLPLVGEVTKGDPAALAGLQPGDLIKSIDGTSITHLMEMQALVKKGGEEKRELAFVIDRNGEKVTASIKPEFNEKNDAYLIGVTVPGQTAIISYGFTESITRGIDRSVELTVMLGDFVKGLFAGAHSMKDLGGPILIAQFAGKAAESGISAFLGMLAFLSLQLGIINLLPIPVLDGGYLLFFSIEGVRGKQMSERVMGTAQNVGLVLLLGLMVVVTWNDIMRLIKDYAL